MASVLVVDDHPDLCALLVRLIRLFGHDAACVLDGAAALARVRGDDPPDLVILDVMMPGMDGFAVLAAVRADAATRAVPVVMYTAVADPDSRERALAMGATDYVVKSLTDFGVVERLIGRYAGRRA